MKTLKSIFLICILHFAFCINSNAQIVYTDVIPDQMITNTLNLDINNDGVNDFRIKRTTSIEYGLGLCTGNKTNVWIKITPLGSNQMIDTVNYPYYPLKLTINRIIDASALAWKNEPNQIMKASTWACAFGNWHNNQAGYWLNSADGFIGIKLITSSQTYYGWLRISVASNSSSFILKDYAYNSIPNQPILAGETSCATPTVNLTQSGSLSFCAGDSVVLTANGTGYLYQWKKNNVNISGVTSKTYVAKTAGVYKCKVTNSCGSKTSGTRTVTVPCKLSDENIVEVLEHLLVYPNPATNSITIKFPSDEAGEIQIVNLFGQVVYSENLGGLETGEIKIDVSKFPYGMYVVRWSSGENYETKTFSIIK